METGTLALLLAVAALTAVTDVDAARRGRAARQVNATTILDKPYLYRGEDGELEGYIEEMVDKLNEKLDDVTIELHTVPDGRYGKDQGSGRWNGMIGQLQRGDVEMAAAPITVSEDRETIVDFTKPFFNFPIVLLVKKGSEEGLESAQDLVSRSDLTYGAVRSGVTEAHFRASNDSVHKQMWEVMKENHVDNTTAGLDRIRSSDGAFAMLVEGPIADYWRGTEPCDLVQVDLGLNIYHQYALVTRQNSDLLAPLNDALHELREDGDLDELKERYWQNTCNGGQVPRAANWAAQLTTILLTMSILSRV